MTEAKATGVSGSARACTWISATEMTTARKTAKTMMTGKKRRRRRIRREACSVSAASKHAKQWEKPLRQHSGLS